MHRLFVVPNSGHGAQAFSSSVYINSCDFAFPIWDAQFARLLLSRLPLVRMVLFLCFLREPIQHEALQCGIDVV